MRGSCICTQYLVPTSQDLVLSGTGRAHPGSLPPPNQALSQSNPARTCIRQAQLTWVASCHFVIALVCHRCKALPPNMKYTVTTIYAYCFLLSAPSFCMPSHPTKFPAFSSIPPIPCWLGSRFADAAFIASTACSLSCTPEDFHGSLPVTLPIVSYKTVNTCFLVQQPYSSIVGLVLTSAAPLTY